MNHIKTFVYVKNVIKASYQLHVYLSYINLSVIVRDNNHKLSI